MKKSRKIEFAKKRLQFILQNLIWHVRMVQNLSLFFQTSSIWESTANTYDNFRAKVPSQKFLKELNLQRSS